MEQEKVKGDTKDTHVGKPDAKNTVVLYDKEGNSILEIYTVEHKVKTNGVGRP